MTKIDISQYDLNKALSNFGGYMALVLSLYGIIVGIAFNHFFFEKLAKNLLIK